jgi:hypothetical protein
MPKPIPLRPSFWNNNNFKAFITHIAKNKDAAGKLQNSLLQHNISAFVAHTDIEPTREWENEIINALNISDGLIALLHTGFHESNWTDHEIGYGIGRGLLVVSVAFGETPYDFIGRYQALPGPGKSYDQLAGEIYRIFLTHLSTRRRMTEVLVKKFAASSSFNQARSLMDQLEEVAFWEDSFTKIVRKAVKENDQVADAWNVPRALEELINRWSAQSPKFD